MRNGKEQEMGEFILLGVFCLFMIAYLIDIHDLPWEAIILSYILSPFILGLALFFLLSALFWKKKSKSDAPQSLKSEELLKMELTLSEGESNDDVNEEKNKIETRRLYKSLSMGCLLFASIFIFGFYFGSGVMLLIWFLLFKKINLTTMIITVTSPLLLYLIFEVFIEFGLYEGQVIQYLNR